MEELLIELRRIAAALEQSNTMNQGWIELNKQWRAEGRAYEERTLATQQAGLDEQKRCNQGIEERVEQWHEQDVAKAEALAKERYEQLAAICWPGRIE